jgi:hypothetical protein
MFLDFQSSKINNFNLNSSIESASPLLVVSNSDSSPINEKAIVTHYYDEKPPICKPCNEPQKKTRKRKHCESSTINNNKEPTKKSAFIQKQIFYTLEFRKLMTDYLEAKRSSKVFNYVLDIYNYDEIYNYFRSYNILDKKKIKRYIKKFEKEHMDEIDNYTEFKAKKLSNLTNRLLELILSDEYPVNLNMKQRDIAKIYSSVYKMPITKNGESISLTKSDIYYSVGKALNRIKESKLHENYILYRTNDIKNIAYNNFIKTNDCNKNDNGGNSIASHTERADDGGSGEDIITNKNDDNKDNNSVNGGGSLTIHAEKGDDDGYNKKCDSDIDSKSLKLSNLAIPDCINSENQRLLDKTILLNIYNKRFHVDDWNLEVQSLFENDQFMLFDYVDATGSCLFDSLRHIVNSKVNKTNLTGKPYYSGSIQNLYMKEIDDFRSRVISNIDNKVTIDGTIYSYSFDPRTRNDWLEMDIDEIIKLTKTINEKNLSIKELIEDKDKNWKDLKNIYFLDDAKTKKLMSVDSVGKYKNFANSRYFYGGPIEILTTAELHNINFCMVNATAGTFETYLSKTNSDDYAFMHYQDLHFRPYYKNIGEDRRYTFKRREVSETILSLFSTTEVAENYYVNLENEFNNIKT